MESTKSFKKAVLVSVVSAAASVLVTYLGHKLFGVMAEKRKFAIEDRKLDGALKDSMDGSDAVAKY